MTKDNRQKPGNADPAEVEIDFFLLLRYLREAWRFIVICMTITFVVVVWHLHNAEPTYEANMVIAPITGSDSAGGGGGSSSGILSLSSVLSSFGGTSSSPQFDQFEYKLTSPSVIHAANADGQLYAWIYPGIWDQQTRKWKKPSGILQLVTGLVRGFFHKPDWLPPDDVMTSAVLSKQITFDALPKSTLTRVTYQNSNRQIAIALLERLFQEADRQIRDQQRQRLNAQIANANAMLAATQVSDLRVAMAQQIAQSQYRLMTVPDSIDYSARQVESPFSASLPVAPKVGLSLALALAISFVFSAFAAVAYRIVEAENARRGKTRSFGSLLRNFFRKKQPIISG